MIFLSCIKESVVQVYDKTRIDVSKSFVSGLPITTLTIKPSASDSDVSVFNTSQDRWYLDWAYSTSGSKTITVTAGDGVTTVSQDFTIEVVTEVADNLYSTDEQLFTIESELKRYLPIGRNSFKNIHREAQSRILNYLDNKRIWNDDGTPLNKDQLNIEDDIQKWSLYEAALIIYTDLFVSVGEKFSEKVNQYKELRNYQRDRATVRIDKDESGTIGDSVGEVQELKSFRMIRR